MAVFTEIERELLERFLAGYDLGPVCAFDPIAEGTENTNYRLETEAGQFVLTIFERRTPADALPYVVALMRQLAQAGQPVPRPIADRRGGALQRLAGKPALIVEFLEGKSVDDPEPEQCRAAGRTLARLHRASAGFRERRANPFGVGSWPRLAEACARRGAPPGLMRRIDRALEPLRRGWPAGLPEGPCHTDLFPDNVFFRKDEVSGVIDLYFACQELLAYDLAVAIVSWCFDRRNSFRPGRAKAMIAGYEEVRALAQEEHAALPLLCLGAAVRFTLTRLDDSLTPQPGALVNEKDPAEFAERAEQFLNCVRV